MWCFRLHEKLGGREAQDHPLEVDLRSDDKIPATMPIIMAGHFAEG